MFNKLNQKQQFVQSIKHYTTTHIQVQKLHPPYKKVQTTHKHVQPKKGEFTTIYIQPSNPPFKQNQPHQNHKQHKTEKLPTKKRS